MCKKTEFERQSSPSMLDNFTLEYLKTALKQLQGHNSLLLVSLNMLVTHVYHLFLKLLQLHTTKLK